MPYHHVGYRIKGVYRLGGYAINAFMNNPTAAQRLSVLEFWDKHGLVAALDHSGKSRRTLYAWRKAYRERGLTGLCPGSRAPTRKRSRRWPRAVVTQIRHWRQELPNLGKEQLQVLLQPWCQASRGLPSPSASTIGRLIAEAPDKMRVSPPALTPKGKPKPYRRSAVKRRPKGYRPHQIGECVGMDAIERRMGSLRRYILTYIDEVGGYALALAVPKLTSRAAKQFFEKGFTLTPFPVQQVITDSGSEFKGEFDQLLSESQIAHLYTYPKTPKMNAVCERFNRTVQEQFVDFHEYRLFDDLHRFNEKLADWLVKYNSLRPHKGLALQTPVQYIIQHNQKCNRWWTHTSCRFSNFSLMVMLSIHPALGIGANFNAVSAVIPRRSRTISLIRAGVTPIAFARA